MSFHKEVIIFVPGFQRDKDRDFYLNFLSAGLTEQLDNINVEEVGDAKIAGNVGKKFQINTNTGSVREIDIYEAYWEDLISNRLSDETLKNKIVRGAYIFYYWFFAKTWLSLREAPALFTGLGVSLLLWILWYYGTLAIAFIAIGQNSDSLGVQIPQEWAKSIGHLGEQMRVLPVWLIISGLLSFIPVNIFANMADFTMRYLEENTEGRVIRAKIRKRVSDILKDVINENIYNKVTIVGHSFGVCIATDLVADYQQGKKIRYISLGGNLKLLSYKTGWIEKEIEKCLNNQNMEAWIDFYSEQDWLCTKTPVPEGSSSRKMKFKKIDLKFNLLKQLNGESHDHYFTDENVLRTILDL